jgi:molecular chaperone DnaK (HSP70)
MCLICNEQDFGTTYSGVSYCLTANPSEVYVIIEWPGARGKTLEKCPTLLKYAGNGSVSWGCEVDRTTEGVIEAIKLHLDPEQPKPIYVPAVDTKAELRRLGKAPVAVASDFMSAIFKHASAKIESKYPAGYFNMLRKQYVLTVPAVWSDKAQDATLRVSFPSLVNAHSFRGMITIKLTKNASQ